MRWKRKRTPWIITSSHNQIVSGGKAKKTTTLCIRMKQEQILKLNIELSSSALSCRHIFMNRYTYMIIHIITKNYFYILFVRRRWWSFFLRCVQLQRREKRKKKPRVKRVRLHTLARIVCLSNEGSSSFLHTVFFYYSTLFMFM